MTRLLPLACLVALAGCRPADDVRTYTVPKPATAAAPAADPSGATDRVLGAFIPAADGQFYSVKLLGPIDAVSAQANTFRAFVETVRVAADPARPPTYTVPAGWQVVGGPTQFRVVTFRIGDGPKPLEPYIAAPAKGSLLDNVNRWRKQVGAAEVTEAELPTAAPEQKLGDSKAYYVDARGSGGAGGMAPFAPKK